MANPQVVSWRFTSKELDSETGLYYYGARYLDPRAGRWMSPDPALGKYLPEASREVEARNRNEPLEGQGGVLNPLNLALYSYAKNNPLRYTDPTGRVDEESSPWRAIGDY